MAEFVTNAYKLKTYFRTQSANIKEITFPRECFSEFRLGDGSFVI